MKKLTVAACVGLVGVWAGSASAAAILGTGTGREFYWDGTQQWTDTNGKLFYFWSNPTNWTDASGNILYDIPKAGDTVYLGKFKKSTQVYKVCDNSNYEHALWSVKVGTNEQDVSQGAFVLQAGGEGLTYTGTKNLTGNWCGLGAVGEGEIPITIENNVVYALQMHYYVKTNKQNPKSNPVLVKKGPGTFVCFNQAGSRTYDIPLTLIRQGTFDFTNTRVMNGTVFGFDGDDESQRLAFCYSSYENDITLQNGAIIETNGVDNTKHGITADADRQVIFTGTPKVNPMTFTGQFYDKAGLKWSPSSADYRFVCSKAVSATQGSLIVATGTVEIADGASFTALSTLQVDKGAVLDVAAVPSQAFKAQNAVLGDATSKIRLVEGASLEFNAASLGGSALKPGLYTADGRDGSRTAAWIEGAGSVVVVTGPANADTWTGGDAGGAAIALAGNWEGNESPDLDEGGFAATFAKGGTEANLPNGTLAKFAGLTLNNSAGSSFAFTAGTDASAQVGDLGIKADDAAAATAWTFGWPIALGSAQTWTVGQNQTVTFNAPLTGETALTLDGPGTTVFNAANNLAGDLTLAKGKLRVTAQGALEPKTRTVNFYHDVAELRIAGKQTVDTPIYSRYIVSNASTYGLTVEDGADVTFNGLVKNYADAKLTVGAGATATFVGGLRTDTDGMSAHIRPRGSGTIVITNNVLSTGHAFQGAAGHPVTIDLRVAGNVVNSVSFFCEMYGRVVTRVVNALNANTWLYLGSTGSLDLDGHNQTLDLIHGESGAKVTSASPATLTVNSTGAGNALHGGTARVDKAAYEGQVSLVKKGTYQHTFAGVSTTTGSVEVAGGTATIDATGKWPNVTDVVLTGGTLALGNAEAIGTNAVWRVTSGTASLAFAGTNSCAKLYVNGVRKSGGVYGPAGSGAQREVPWLSGTGFLQVAEHGLVLFIR